MVMNTLLFSDGYALITIRIFHSISAVIYKYIPLILKHLFYIAERQYYSLVASFSYEFLVSKICHCLTTGCINCVFMQKFCASLSLSQLSLISMSGKMIPQNSNLMNQHRLSEAFKAQVLRNEYVDQLLVLIAHTVY